MAVTDALTVTPLDLRDLLLVVLPRFDVIGYDAEPAQVSFDLRLPGMGIVEDQLRMVYRLGKVWESRCWILWSQPRMPSWYDARGPKEQGRSVYLRTINAHHQRGVFAVQVWLETGDFDDNLDLAVRFLVHQASPTPWQSVAIGRGSINDPTSLGDRVVLMYHRAAALGRRQLEALLPGVGERYQVMMDRLDRP